MHSVPLWLREHSIRRAEDSCSRRGCLKGYSAVQMLHAVALHASMHVQDRPSPKVLLLLFLAPLEIRFTLVRWQSCQRKLYPIRQATLYMYHG